MALSPTFDQKVVLQINLITEDEGDRAYQTAFYRVERILTALDIIATLFLLIIDFISFVRQDILEKHNTFTAVWKLGCFRTYVVILVVRLLAVEVLCGKALLYAFRYV